jgi:hypothetical protein
MMNDRPDRRQAAPAGLCDTCRHRRDIVSDRGSVFIFCARSKTDDRYPRYPRLPVLACAGYEDRIGGAGL